MKKLLNRMKGIIGERALAALLAFLITEKNIKKGLKILFDYAEVLAKKTRTKIDDEAIVKIRKVLNI